MNPNEYLLEFILSGELFVERHYNCNGSIVNGLSNEAGELIFQLSDDQWCRFLACFGVIRQFKQDCGCVIELIDPSYTDPEKAFEDIAF